MLGAFVAPAARATAPRAGENGPHARLTAAFRPKRLGAPTTIEFSVALAPTQGAPPPISKIEVGYPDNLGFATSGLGLAACDPAVLEIVGAQACPPNSKMGQGSAVVEVPFGPAVIPENVTLAVYAAPSDDGLLHLGILVVAKKPVEASIVMGAVVLPGRLRITVPAIVGVPGGPNVSLVRMSASLGGTLTYYQDVGGRRVAYQPRGIGLPDSCPQPGWRWAVGVSFLDGTRSRAQTVIPCPTGVFRTSP